MLRHAPDKFEPDDAGNEPPGKGGCIAFVGLQVQFDDSDITCQSILNAYKKRGYCM